MKRERRTTQNIKTIGALLDRRRTRSAGGAMLELSTLAYERTRLGHELDRLENRRAEIGSRLRDIGDKERWLRAFADRVPGHPSVQPLPLPNRQSAFVPAK